MKYLFVLGAILIAATAQMMLKKSSGFTSGSFDFWKWFISACCLFAASTFASVFVMRLFPASKTTAILSIGTIILSCVGGVLLFHETVTIKQCIGLIMGFGAVILIIT